MLKILQINKLFYPWIGGVETVVKQLADGLAEDVRFEVGVLAGSEIKSSKTSISKDLGYQVYKTASSGIKFSTPISISYPAALRKLIQYYDVFHFHVPNPLGELAHFLWAIPYSKKVIVTYHADVKKTRWSFLYFPYSILLKKLLKRADVIVTTAPNNLSNSALLTKFKSKCVVVPLGYDPVKENEMSEAEKNKFAAKYKLDSRRMLLFVGRLGYYKGIDVLLKAIKNLDVQLVIAGEGGLRSKLEEIVDSEGIAGKVIFTGFLSNKELMTAYASAYLFVLPSVSEAEAFGIVQLEAMHFGVPVINTNLPTGVPFVSVDALTGYTVSPSSVEELSNAIRKLLNDEPLRQRLGNNAKVRASMFTTAAMVDAYKKIYLQLYLNPKC